MSVTLLQARANAMYRLGDSAGTVWSTAEIDEYLKDAYDRLAMHTGMFWESDYLDDVAGQATHTVPTKLYQMERVAWNNQRIEPILPHLLERHDQRYETTQGPVYAYLMEKDGLRTLRKYRVPSKSKAIAVTGTWGIPRSSFSELSGGGSITGTFGIPRYINPFSAPAFPTWGIPRQFHADENNTRIEFTRRGAALDDIEDTFELPDRYVKYCRHFAEGKALERESAGQDLKLAAHFLQRYERGAQRIARRMAWLDRTRTGQLGGPARRRVSVPTPSLPWQFPRRKRF